LTPFRSIHETVGTLVHGFARNIDWRIVGLLMAGSVPATAATLALLSTFDLPGGTAHHLITLSLGVVLVLTSAFLLGASKVRARYADRVSQLDDRIVAVLTAVLGAVMGVLVTMTSVGAGAIGVTVLFFLYPRMPASRIVGSDIAHAVPLTLVAGAGHWYLGSVDWALLGPLLIGSLPGIVVGSKLAGRIPDGAVHTGLTLVLIIVAVKLIG
jgi:uncharacterized membrane protein YfcA